MISVAPHVGAWIETRRDIQDNLLDWVAPHVGAWIETRNACRLALSVSSRTSRRCVDCDKQIKKSYCINDFISSLQQLFFYWIFGLTSFSVSHFLTSFLKSSSLSAGICTVIDLYFRSTFISDIIKSNFSIGVS